MDTSKIKRYGRAYQCIHCLERTGKVYVDVKKRVEEHIAKQHLAQDDMPYICTLCHFRCATLKQQLSHVTGYSRHVSAAQEAGITEHTQFMEHNPYVFTDKDYKQFTQQESVAYFTSRAKNSSGSKDAVQVALDEAGLGGDTLVTPPIVHASPSNAQPLEGSWTPVTQFSMPEMPVSASMPLLSPQQVQQLLALIPASQTLNQNIVKPVCVRAEQVKTVAESGMPERSSAFRVVNKVKKTPVDYLRSLCSVQPEESESIIEEILPNEPMDFSTPKHKEDESEQPLIKKAKLSLPEDREQRRVSPSPSVASSCSSDSSAASVQVEKAMSEIKTVIENSLKGMQKEMESSSRALRQAEKALKEQTEATNSLNKTMRDFITAVTNGESRREVERRETDRRETERRDSDRRETERRDSERRETERRETERREKERRKENSNKENRMRSVLGRSHHNNSEWKKGYARK